VRLDAIEVTGFPDLVRRYAISGVPKTVLAEGVEFVGAGSEAMLLDHVLRAAEGDGADRP
jgi:hypothetical protein